MKNKNSVWIDPQDCGLVTLEEAERKRRAAEEARRRAEEERERQRQLQAQQEAERQRRREQEEREERQRRATEERRKARVQEEVRMTKTNRPIEGEIVSAGRAIATKPVQTRDFESLAMHLQNLIQQMIETLDLTKPEGLLDRFRGVGRRIEVRIERAGQLRNLLDAFGNTIDELRTIAEKLGQLNRVAVRQQLQRLEDEYALLQAQIRIDNAHAEAHQRWRLEEARVNTEIAKLEAEAEIARRDALPPPPPPPPAPAAPPPVDQFTREKDEARRAKQQEADLNIQDTDIRADAAEKKVARARARAIEIFNNSQLNTGETRECIYAVLDEFGFDTSILPEKIRDFLKTNDTTEDYTDEVQ